MSPGKSYGYFIKPTRAPNLAVCTRARCRTRRRARIIARRACVDMRSIITVIIVAFAALSRDAHAATNTYVTQYDSSSWYASRCTCADGFGDALDADAVCAAATTPREDAQKHCAYARAQGASRRWFRVGRGADYRGRAVSRAASGRPCATWRHDKTAHVFGAASPHGFDRGMGDNALGRGHAGCRNPSHEFAYGLWCFVDEANDAWEYCDDGAVGHCDRDREQLLDVHCADGDSSASLFCERMREMTRNEESVCASSPYAFYDNLAELIREREPTSSLLERRRNNTMTLPQITSKFAASLAEIVGLTTPCAAMSSSSSSSSYQHQMCPELVAEAFFAAIPQPTHDIDAMAQNIKRIPIASIINRRQINAYDVSEDLLARVSDFLVERLPEAAFASVVSVGVPGIKHPHHGDDDDAWHAHNVRDITRLFDVAVLQEQRVSCTTAEYRIPLCVFYAVTTSLQFCAANAMAEYVADVGPNGLYLGPTFEYTEKMNRALWSYDKNRDLAHFIARWYPESLRAFNRAACHLKRGEDKFVLDIASKCPEFAKRWSAQVSVYEKLITAFDGLLLDDYTDDNNDRWIDDCSRYDVEAMDFDVVDTNNENDDNNNTTEFDEDSDEYIEMMRRKLKPKYREIFISTREFSTLLVRTGVMGALLVIGLSRIARALNRDDELSDSGDGIYSYGDEDSMYFGDSNNNASNSGDAVSHMIRRSLYYKDDPSSAYDTRVGRFVRMKHRGYKILEEIGRGGNGVVYLASVDSAENNKNVNSKDNTSNAAAVAVKEPHNKYKAKLEISVLESIPKSDYLCEYLGAVVDPNTRTWMMMFELCQHGSLRACLRAGTYPRDGETIFNALAMMMSGVDHIHASSTAHRDIKMENFLIACDCCETFNGTRLQGRCRQTHTIKISDLGLAKCGDMMYDTSAQFTGTLCYVAPERLSILPGQVTPETYELADLYGFGLAAWEILYYAAFGASKSILDVIFSDENERRTLSDAQMMIIISTGGMKPTMSHIESPRIRDWLERCVAFDPRDRFESLTAARRALQDLRSEFIRLFRE